MFFINNVFFTYQCLILSPVTGIPLRSVGGVMICRFKLEALPWLWGFLGHATTAENTTAALTISFSAALAVMVLLLNARLC